jgi:hypothetical protein
MTPKKLKYKQRDISIRSRFCDDVWYYKSSTRRNRQAAKRLIAAELKDI